MLFYLFPDDLYTQVFSWELEDKYQNDHTDQIEKVDDQVPVVCLVQAKQEHNSHAQSHTKDGDDEHDENSKP